MNREIYVTIIEKGNQECPNIGTIFSKYGDSGELTYKFLEAISSHFDVEMDSISIKNSLDILGVKNSPPINTVVTIDDQQFDIQIQQTFFY
jgi:hypothetical protein